jgi:hypothetical protein
MYTEIDTIPGRLMIIFLLFSTSFILNSFSKFNQFYFSF